MIELKGGKRKSLAFHNLIQWNETSMHRGQFPSTLIGAELVAVRGLDLRGQFGGGG